MENTSDVSHPQAEYKILLVEDDKLDQKAFERLVKDENLPYDYTIAGSVSKAKGILASEQFDAVIADYALGDGNAFDVLEVVKNTPTVIVTGTGNEEVAVKAWKAGACDYLIKDLERNYLKALPITVENVIRHKRMEDKLHLLSGAIMSTDDSVYITDMENKFIFVNRAFCETYGYQEQEIVGKDSNILWIGKLQHKGTRSVFQIVSSAWEVGFYHKRKDDSVFPVSLSRSIIKDCSGKEIAVIGVVRDISDRIAMEDELRTTNQKLERRNHLKSELAIAVSEELKNLIDRVEKFICGAATAAAGEIGAGLKEGLESARKNIDNAKGIISDFLEVSNIDTNRIKLEIIELDLRSVVTEVVETLSPLASEKCVELKSSIPDCELIVEADRDKITQVLTSLISNSINSVSANGHINVRAEDRGNEITVEVQDDGPAIESDRMNRIFNRFDQIRTQLRAGREELSLALPIARELVEMHGGWIWAEGGDGRGNSFSFTLPKPSVQPVERATKNTIKTEISQ
jgi:PAS domain S-box-containing protein